MNDYPPPTPNQLRGRREATGRDAGTADIVQLSQSDIAVALSAIYLVATILRRANQQGILPPTLQKPSRPPVSIQDTVHDDYIVCLEDGARVKLLAHYLRRFGLTPQQYREKWDLPSDYPMVAHALSVKRAAIARSVKPHLARGASGKNRAGGRAPPDVG